MVDHIKEIERSHVHLPLLILQEYIVDCALFFLAENLVTKLDVLLSGHVGPIDVRNMDAALDD